jgi:head-tail adaptor
MASAGALDRFVQFRRATISPGALEQVETWANHGAPVWASKADLSDGEKWRGGEVSASVTTRFVLRWSPFTSDISPKDRLICEGVTYEIVGKKEGKGRRQWIELTCAARSDQ